MSDSRFPWNHPLTLKIFMASLLFDLHCSSFKTSSKWTYYSVNVCGCVVVWCGVVWCGGGGGGGSRGGSSGGSLGGGDGGGGSAYRAATGASWGDEAAAVAKR